MNYFDASLLLRPIGCALLALSATLFLGAFLGWNDHPGEAEAVTFAVDELRAKQPLINQRDIERVVAELRLTHPAFLAPRLHPVVAILRSHIFLLGLFTLVSLLAFRPAVLQTAIVFTLLALSFTAAAGLVTAILLICAVLVYAVAALAFGWRNSRVAA